MNAAAARNLGARRAAGSVLLFVDADVEVCPDAVARIRSRFEADPGLTAVFGSYDDSPSAPGVVSGFRNLLHHHVHQNAEGPATTFWTGLGAVRREAFESVGGFDETVEFMEDIDLGMRLSAAGARIELDPRVQGTHLKRWSLWSMVRTDFIGRGVPWVLLLLRHRGSTTALNLGWRHRISALAALAGSISLVLRNVRGIVVSVAALVALNHSFYALLWRRRGGSRRRPVCSSTRSTTSPAWPPCRWACSCTCSTAGAASAAPLPRHRPRSGEGGEPRRSSLPLATNGGTRRCRSTLSSIEHPAGPVLFDTGQTARAAAPGWFPRWHPFFRLSRFELAQEDEIAPRLRALGVEPAAVGTVVLSHLHTDHVGGVDAFADADVLVPPAGVGSSRPGSAATCAVTCRSAGRLGSSRQLVDIDGAPVGPFRASYDVAGDGRLLLVPTPGHTAGHAALLVRDGNRSWLLAGDLAHTAAEVEHVAPEIARWCRAEDVEILTSHDPAADSTLCRRMSSTPYAPHPHRLRRKDARCDLDSSASAERHGFTICLRCQRWTARRRWEATTRPSSSGSRGRGRQA